MVRCMKAPPKIGEVEIPMKRTVRRVRGGRQIDGDELAEGVSCHLRREELGNVLERQRLLLEGYVCLLSRFE